jgi:hypothetical protein
VRRLEKQAGDDLFVRACDRFDESIMGGAVEIESAIFHLSSIQT